MQTLYVDSINDGPSDYAGLFQIAGDVAAAGWRARLDFTTCSFLRQNAVAFLGGLARMAHHHGGQLEFAWTTLQAPVAANLAQSGFMYAFGRGREGWNGNSIPFHADGTAKAHEFATYLRDRWLGRGWVNVSPALADRIVGNVSEVYVNAFEHAASPVGITCCGQFYPKMKELKLTLVDFGVGIPTKVRAYMQGPSSAPLWTPESCMHWAFQSGTTTKPSASGGPSGLGLDLLLSFVRLNGGNLEMFSHEGHALITPNNVQFSACASFFPGTLVTISLICDEEYYCLNSELPGPMPF
jgi:hypothetical protein